MDDAQALRSMVRDDAYRVTRVLADGPSGRTELVTLDGEGPLVRKRMPLALANASAWAACLDIDEPLLPRMESLYRMPDELVVVYAYVPGSSLRELVDESGRLGARRAAELVCDVCHAVSTLHERGVVHRDITPGNVIVADDGAHLVDLGIARRRVRERRRDTTTLGTWGFAAPEQFGFAQTDARSDVYSIGCLLGFALTGVLPGTDGYDALLDNARAVVPGLAAVVRRATAFEPSSRYQGARELGEAACAAMGMVYQRSCERRRAEEAVPAIPLMGHTTRHTTGHTTEGAKKADASSWRNFAADAQPYHPGGSMSKGLGEQPQEAPGSSAPAFTSAEAPPAMQLVADASDAPDPEPLGGARPRSAQPPSVLRLLPASMPFDVASGPRPLSEVPLPQLVGSIVAWLVLAFGAFLVVATSVDAIVHRNPPWRVSEYAMAVVSVSGLGAMALDLYRALTNQGPYASREGAWHTLLHRLCIIMGVTFFILCICALAPPSSQT